MTADLKEKALTGVSWSFIDNICRNGINFLIGIVLARLLSPVEFGIIGIVMIFVLISNVIVDSGFSQALIRKRNCSLEDYSTVFFYNLCVSIVFYFVLFFASGMISALFDEPILKNVLKLVGLVLIINSFHTIQKTIIFKNINFRFETKINAVSFLFAGLIGIVLAYFGYGVWSLVVKMLALSFFTTAFYWFFVNWRPSLIFSKASFFELFGFGSKLLLSSLITTTFNNIYHFVIAKFFSTEMLGYFQKAVQFSNLPSQSLNSICLKVLYPVLSSINDDDIKLKSALKKIIRMNIFISSFMMLLLAVIAEPLIILLLGPRWLVTAQYLSIICFVGVFMPVYALNQNMMKVKGRSDLFLYCQIIENSLLVPAVFIGIFIGIIPMLYAMVTNSLIIVLVSSYFTGKIIDYGTKEQLWNIFPCIMITGLPSLIVLYFTYYLRAGNIETILISIFAMPILTLIVSELFKFKPYIELKEIGFSQLKKIKR